jgi:flagellar biosynthesis protein FlhG
MDQASDLRRLVRFDSSERPVAAAPAPRLIAVAGGKGGVGTTTMAVNLSVALVLAGRRTILVDADLNGADVAGMCRLNDRYSLAHVLSGARSVHEALCLGPGGILVLPGAWGHGKIADCPPQSQERLLAALRRMGDHADFVVLDVGSGLNRVVRRFWHAADHVVLVTTPEDASVMDAYASIKVLADGDPQLSIGTLVNRAPPHVAADVHGRLSRVCQRFLGVRLACLGHVPESWHVLSAVRTRQPLMLASPQLEPARRCEAAAQRLLSMPACASEPVALDAILA